VIGDFALRLPAALAFGIAMLGTAAANAEGCPGNPGAMGTSRVLKIDPHDYQRIGTVQYRDSLPLEEKEVVLTFDDGPLPPYTNRVLEALKYECVKANYFVVGRMARGYPDLLRRIAAEGHVIGTHSENHPLAFEKMPIAAARQEIDKGFASAATALGGQGTVAPFFRFPGLLRADPVEGYLRSRNMVTWSADVVADDWKHITAAEVVKRSLARLDARGKGILLLHDIQPATALAIPHLLRELKRRGYKIVQVVPETAAAMVAAADRRAPAREAQTAPEVTEVRPHPASPPQPQPQPRQTVSTWPTPFPARSAPPAPPPQPSIAPAQATASHARPVAAAPVRNEPELSAAAPAPNQPPPALEQIVGQIAGAQAAARAANVPADPDSLPTGRAMPVSVVKAARLAPVVTSAPDSRALEVARPLTPGFKPSHSASLPMKIYDMPVEPVAVAPAPPAAPATEPANTPTAPAAPEQAAKPGPDGRGGQAETAKSGPAKAETAKQETEAAKPEPPHKPSEQEKAWQKRTQPEPPRQAHDQPAEAAADNEPRAQGDPAADRPDQPEEEAPPGRMIDVWSNRASLKPAAAPAGSWPVTAWGLRPRPR
jgi:peptidoglycan/xylan/chitin deacetylase (PgdA/CDA1 family)